MTEVLKRFPGLLVHAFTILKRNDPLILASSTAFFTTFSISPILVILVNIFSLYFKNEEIKNQLFEKLRNALGAESADQIQSIVENVRTIESNLLFTFLGFLFLVFVATTLLIVVKHAINRIWSVKRKHVSRLKYTLSERVISVSLILTIGLLFIASLLLDTTVSVAHNYLHQVTPSIDTALVTAINTFFSLLVVTLWFMILFKILPDARVHWNVAFVGGLITAILFNVGKWVLGTLLLYSKVVTIFGASASFALILLFIFYASMILYYGAAFTFAFGDAVKKPIAPGKYSNRFEERVIT